MLTSVLAGLSILIVGDSHLLGHTSLIDTLHTGLENHGAEVRTLGVCGSTPGDWIKSVPGSCGASTRAPKGEIEVVNANASTTPITQLITLHKPNLVVIVMGDTVAGYKEGIFPKTWAWQQVTSLTQAISKTGTACVWIGPSWGVSVPNFNKTDMRTKQVATFLSSNVAPCEFIDSTKLSKPREWATKTDGQHYTRSVYQAWGTALTQELLNSPTVKALEKK